MVYSATSTYGGDQRALFRGTEIDQGVVMPGNPAYNTYKWGATSWGADGTLNGGVAEADFNDVIDGSTGRNAILLMPGCTKLHRNHRLRKPYGPRIKEQEIYILLI